ncbi:MAG: FAD-dependent oxidoreductase [Myxococcales bacterium]|nr:FAD-dependent oxidoreductase [Myxococcales bacterium]
MRIAIVGTGISGLVCGYLLHREHDLTVFEANDYIGGHTHTHVLDRPQGTVTADTGFMVFNERTYPNFIRLLDRLGVASRPSEMSFSVRDERAGLEWCGTNLNTVFAQRRNLLRPGFLRMLAEIARFNRESRELLGGVGDDISLGEYLDARGYSRRFREHYLLPMGAAIWSATPAAMLAFPARMLVRFYENHGLLDVVNQPTWRVVTGGSHRYVQEITRGWRDRIRLRAPIEDVRRFDGEVLVKPRGGEPERFDQVILASHADQSLGMLTDASEAEREILGAFPYQPNRVTLHNDERLLPRLPRARASWNYHVVPDTEGAATVTYDLTRLQHIPGFERLCATLNRDEAIDPASVIRRMDYAHPILGPAAVGAQRQWEKVNGVRRTWFAGAYWGYGFHEDGVNSGLRVCESFGKSLETGP